MSLHEPSLIMILFVFFDIFQFQFNRVGTGVGARLGILIKSGEALEIGSKVDSVVFDKTGTLTKGEPAITDFVQWGDDADTVVGDYLLWLLASLERTSEHPLAKAVVRYAEENLDPSYLESNPLVEPTMFRALTGRGASGTIQGKVSVAVGNRSFASVLGLTIPPQAEIDMQRLEEQGKTAILVAVNESICAVIGIADELKADAAESIVYLKEVMGVDVWMVTGDNARTANAISRQINLSPDRVISEALPAAKVQQVRKLQAEGRVVVMVGDGINDAAGKFIQYCCSML
jgi:Cu+-exporting ATPase